MKYSSLNNKWNQTINSHKIRIRKNTFIKCKKSFRTYKRVSNKLKISTNLNKENPRFFPHLLKEFLKQLNAIGSWPNKLVDQKQFHKPISWYS